MLLSAGSTAIPGWTVINGGLAWDGPTNPYGLTASDGSYFLDLTGDHDNPPYAGVGQSQTIATTIGAVYQLSFDLGTDPTYDTEPVGIQVTAGSVQQETFMSGSTPPESHNQWQTFTVDFTATSANTSLSLVGVVESETNPDQEYIGLDNVLVDEVPEPGTLTLIVGPGLLAIAAWRGLRKA